MFLAATLGLAMVSAPHNDKFQITGVSLFKNGFALVTREMPVGGSGDYEIVDMPSASLGTLWFAATDGAKLDEISTTTVRTTTSSPAGSLDAVLARNINRTVELGFRDGYTFLGRSITGKLLSAKADLIIIQTEMGTNALSRADVTSVSSKEDLLYTTDVETSHKALRFKVADGSKGKITMVSLERGLTWAPAYAVELHPDKRLTLTAKSTMLNDLEDLSKVETRFITGFPNVPFASAFDPLTSNVSVDAFMSLLNGIGDGQQIRTRAGDMMTQNAYGSLSAGPKDVAEGMPTSPLAGQQQEDLFFYKQPNVNLQKGERAYYTLFRAEAPYEEVYCWDMDDFTVNNVDYRGVAEGSNDVWHALQFKNSSGQPLTTAVATTFKNGEVIGQDMMHYVPAGGDVELRITKALDVHVEASEVELSRERGAITRNNQPIYDLVTLKGSLVAANNKPETVKLRIKKEFTGELVSADGKPEATKTAKGLRAINPVGRLVWTQSLEPGKTLTLTYTYKLYVRSQ